MVAVGKHLASGETAVAGVEREFGAGLGDDPRRPGGSPLDRREPALPGDNDRFYLVDGGRQLSVGGSDSPAGREILTQQSLEYSQEVIGGNLLWLSPDIDPFGQDTGGGGEVVDDRFDGALSAADSGGALLPLRLSSTM